MERQSSSSFSPSTSQDFTRTAPVNTSWSSLTHILLERFFLVLILPHHCKFFSSSRFSWIDTDGTAVVFQLQPSTFQPFCLGHPVQKMERQSSSSFSPSTSLGLHSDCSSEHHLIIAPERFFLVLILPHHCKFFSSSRFSWIDTDGTAVVFQLQPSTFQSSTSEDFTRTSLGLLQWTPPHYRPLTGTSCGDGSFFLYWYRQNSACLSVFDLLKILLRLVQWIPSPGTIVLSCIDTDRTTLVSGSLGLLQWTPPLTSKPAGILSFEVITSHLIYFQVEWWRDHFRSLLQLHFLHHSRLPLAVAVTVGLSYYDFFSNPATVPMMVMNKNDDDNVVALSHHRLLAYAPPSPSESAVHSFCHYSRPYGQKWLCKSVRSPWLAYSMTGSFPFYRWNLISLSCWFFSDYSCRRCRIGLQNLIWIWVLGILVLTWKTSRVKAERVGIGESASPPGPLSYGQTWHGTTELRRVLFLPRYSEHRCNHPLTPLWA
jgi:hypothetical protein